MNQVILVGKLSQDPEYEITETGKKRTIINIAVTRGFKNSEGKYETDFIRCVLWNGMASATKDYCHIGDTIGIKGRVQNSSYVNDKNETKYISEIIAERISFIASSNKNRGLREVSDEDDAIIECF